MHEAIFEAFTRSLTEFLNEKSLWRRCGTILLRSN